MCPPRSGLLGVVDIELVSRLSAKAGITEGSDQVGRILASSVVVAADGVPTEHADLIGIEESATGRPLEQCERGGAIAIAGGAVDVEVGERAEGDAEEDEVGVRREDLGIEGEDLLLCLATGMVVDADVGYARRTGKAESDLNPRARTSMRVGCGGVAAVGDIGGVFEEHPRDFFFSPVALTVAVAVKSRRIQACLFLIIIII